MKDNELLEKVKKEYPVGTKIYLNSVNNGISQRGKPNAKTIIVENEELFYIEVENEDITNIKYKNCLVCSRTHSLKFTWFAEEEKEI